MPSFHPPASFHAPDWDAPLDTDAYIRAVPEAAQIKGMYTIAIVDEAKRRGLTLAHARDRYLPFLDYPMRSHLEVLVEATRAFFPELSIRRALRKFGHSAVDVFTGSTLGRAAIGGLTQPETATRAIIGVTRAYTTALTKPAAHVEVKELSDTSCSVRISDFWVFLDSHQIGILEGVCRACGVRGEILVAMEAPSRGELLCSWTAAPTSRPSAP